MIRLKMPTPSMAYAQKMRQKQNLTMHMMARLFMIDLAGRMEQLGGRLLHKNFEVTLDGIYADINVLALPTLPDMVKNKNVDISRFSNHIVREIKTFNRVVGSRLYPIATNEDVLAPNESWTVGWLEIYLESLTWFSRLNINDETSEETLGDGIEQSMEHYHIWDIEQIEFAAQEEKRALVARHNLDVAITALVADAEKDIMSVVGNADKLEPHQIEWNRRRIQDRVKDSITMLLADTLEDVRIDNNWFAKDDQLVRDIEAKRQAKVWRAPPRVVLNDNDDPFNKKDGKP